MSGKTKRLITSICYRALCSPWALILTISSLRESTFSSSCLFLCSTLWRQSVRDLILASYCKKKKRHGNNCKFKAHTAPWKLSLNSVRRGKSHQLVKAAIWLMTTWSAILINHHICHYGDSIHDGRGSNGKLHWPGRCAAGRQSAPSHSPPSSGCSRPGSSPAVCCASPSSSPLTSSCWCRDEPQWTPHR